MNIDQFRKFVNFIANKSQSGSNPTTSEFNLAVERGFVEWVMDNYGNKAEYTTGREVPRKAWQKTQKISDDLRFLLEKRLFEVPTTGRLKIPNGVDVKDTSNEVAPKYLHISSVRHPYNVKCNNEIQSIEVGVDVLRDAEIGSVLESQIVYPTEKYPVCAFYNDYIQFYPKKLGFVFLTYLRIPKVPKWGFTLNSNNREVYNPDDSIDIESPDETHNDIAIRVLRYLGIHIRENALLQYSEQMKQEGI